ncbi:MAG: hypothetical protein MJZ16_03365 [Bacteroidales bacterium]|nr:hypothetical protein [Bacteroidales bacterium]
MNLFEQYGYTPVAEEISRSLEMIASNVETNSTPEVLKACFAAMDVTTLHTNDTVSSVKKLVEKVNSIKTLYPEYPLPASVCVYPNFASVVAETRNNPDIQYLAVSLLLRVSLKLRYVSVNSQLTVVLMKSISFLLLTHLWLEITRQQVMRSPL